jgi:nitronate monooxygenase
MRVKTTLSQALKLACPIIQGPMAGGGDTPALVAAVSEAGGLGFIGAAYLSPEQIVEAAKSVRTKTSKPFGINLFAPSNAKEGAADAGPMIKRLAVYAAELGIPPPALSTTKGVSFDDQVAAVAQTDAAAFSFTFGVPGADALKRIKAKGMFVLGTATTVDEAIELEAAGVNAVIAQGSEAGGHRGTFAAEFSAAMVGVMALVPQTVDAVRIPVVAAGGIMDGRGIAAALTLGASGVQMGTAFLTCDEAGPPAVYKERILKAREHETRVTRTFSGRPARGIVNRLMEEVDAAASEIAPFPIQNALTRPIRSAAAQQGKADYLSLWAGQGLRLARRAKAGNLVAQLISETEAALAR